MRIRIKSTSIPINLKHACFLSVIHNLGVRSNQIRLKYIFYSKRIRVRKGQNISIHKMRREMFNVRTAIQSGRSSVLRSSRNIFICGAAAVQRLVKRAEKL